MTPSIPLIRAGAIFPILRWMREAGGDRDRYLTPVDLCWVDGADPFKAIPVRNVAMLLRDLSRNFGPDVPWRIVGNLGFSELGLLVDLSVADVDRYAFRACRNRCDHRHG